MRTLYILIEAFNQCSFRFIVRSTKKLRQNKIPMLYILYHIRKHINNN